MTNVLVEGGSQLLGTLFDMRAVDEVHVFIAPKLAGGAAAPGPSAAPGSSEWPSALKLADITIEELDGDVYVHGRIRTLIANRRLVTFDQFQRRPARRVFVERKRRPRGERLQAQLAVVHGVREADLPMLMRIVAAERDGRHERRQPVAGLRDLRWPLAARAGESAGRFRGRG